ncbi:RNA polymerase sigma factor [Filimonas effusa]|uniref:RNA polymerase sigma factor n=1 Tax=Filimonas effusa TaxID=2508721 RepID=UPI0013E8F7C0|nr:RNA polymerase sigma-70 factor [Filimonas effusa]
MTAGIPYKSQSEKSLVLQLKGGCTIAFTELYHQYSERLYYNILALVKDSFTAEELVQDIFARIWHKREQLEIDHSFGGYLFTAGRNRVYDFFATATRDQQLYDRIRSTASETYSHIEEALLYRENAGILQKAIAHLSPQRRRVFELCKIEGCSYKEASVLLSISLATVKDHMTQARNALRKYLEEHEEVLLGLAFSCFCKNL